MNRPDRQDPSEDELLAIRCQLGERAAFDELVTQWGPRLRTYLRRLLASDADADDLVQDVWLRALRGLPGLRDPARFRSWLFGIAHRAMIDRLRERYASRIDDAAEPEQIGALDPAFEREIDRQVLEQGLASLLLPDRETISLFYLEGLSLAEIAGTQCIPIGTVKSRLHRARISLRRNLVKRGETA